MNFQEKIRPIDVMVLVAIGGLIAWNGMTKPSSTKLARDSFANQVDLAPFHTVAIQADGRLRSFGSHAKTYMGYVSGPRSVDGQGAGFTYLDLIFNPDKYIEKDIFYVKNKQVRYQIVDLLVELKSLTPAHEEEIRKSGLLSRSLLLDDRVLGLLRKLGQDLIRTAKSVDRIQQALGVADPSFLSRQLRVIAPPSGKIGDPWISLADVIEGSGVPADSVHAGMSKPKRIPGFDPELQSQVSDAWQGLRTAWRDEDSEAVNAKLAQLSGLFPSVSPALYPARERLGMESWYFRSQGMTWVWLIYLASVVPLLMSVIYKWNGARTVGMIFFVVAFLAQTASIGIRWYISGRWPNANMFEAVTTAAWMGGVLAVALEWFVRKTAFRNLFALGSAVMSMGALMAAYFLPTGLDSSISNKMAALNDIWLYIHTNVIIWSYAIIGLACIPALLFLRQRWCMLWDRKSVPKLRLLVLPIALVCLNWTGYKLLMHVLDDPSRSLDQAMLYAMGGLFWGSLMLVFLELADARTRQLAQGSVEKAASGGASVFILGGAGGSSFLQKEQPTLSQVYDGATMVLVELSFVMLWAGVVMGAIWADHSWGRPWGWDPKEVFALNTFIIFLVLIHVRLKVRDKGFWTAVLALIGFEVMMFNWIAVNFVIVGLHSYA